MSDRFRNKVAGRGTNWHMQKAVEHYQNLVKKRENLAREGGKKTPKAAARVKKTKEKLAQWKALAVQGDAELRRKELEGGSSPESRALVRKKKAEAGVQQVAAQGSSSSSAGGPTIFTDLERVLNEEPLRWGAINDGREGGVRSPLPLGADIEVANGDSQNAQRDQEQPKEESAGGAI